MIRFIDLGDQIIEDYPQFAWFDTITDTFIEMSGDQTWDNWEEFEESYNIEKEAGNIPESWPLERFKRLFPKDWNRKRKVYEILKNNKALRFFFRDQNLKYPVLYKTRRVEGKFKNPEESGEFQVRFKNGKK
jgi:hypothetical protein